MWVTTPRIGRVLGGYHHRVACRLTGKKTSERTGRLMGVYPSGGRGGRGRITGGGDLCLPLTEHSRTVHCDQDHYGPMYGSGAEARVKGGQAVVGAGRLGLGGDADIGLGGGTDGGIGGDGQDRGGYGERLNRWGGYCRKRNLRGKA